jgi:hypothetical protein
MLCAGDDQRELRLEFELVTRELSRVQQAIDDLLA